MAHGIRLSAWSALALGLALGALLAWPLPRAGLDWQPTLAASAPWRAWSAAFVHWSTQHLLANLAGCAALLLLGRAAALPGRCAWAWALAWPLSHWGLLLRPELAHYGGLSGVLHAGVAVAALELLLRRRGRQRSIGALIALGLALKLALEDPLGPALQTVAGWDIALAPFAHLSGALSGLLAGAICALAPQALAAWRGARRA